MSSYIVINILHPPTIVIDVINGFFSLVQEKNPVQILSLLPRSHALKIEMITFFFLNHKIGSVRRIEYGLFFLDKLHLFLSIRITDAIIIRFTFAPIRPNQQSRILLKHLVLLFFFFSIGFTLHLFLFIHWWVQIKTKKKKMLHILNWFCFKSLC